jgi:hypothetical protein
MILAVVTRASLGHTGQPLTATVPVQLVYLAADIAALDRVLAICEAVRRPTMRFVTVKTAKQQGRLMRHGGNLGQVTKGTTTPEFEAVLPHLRMGEISAALQIWMAHRSSRPAHRGNLAAIRVRTRALAGYLAERSQRLAIALTSRAPRCSSESDRGGTH